MEKVKRLNWYQRGVLIIMAAMSLIFAAVYARTISKVGFEYKNAVFVPGQEHGSTVYSGKIKGQKAYFTVSEDQTVLFQYGDKSYGPYTLKEDDTAIPEGEEKSEYMTGVEICKGDDILFRGGVLEHGDSYWLYREDGTIDDFGCFYISGDGTERDENGNVIDPVEPSASVIFELMHEPELTHKGDWFAWFSAVFLCLLNAFSILFADELFRWHLAFQIRDADHAEPSDWEIAGRYLGWTVVTIAAFAIFLTGLQ